MHCLCEYTVAHSLLLEELVPVVPEMLLSVLLTCQVVAAKNWLI
jgi:hypothetical protein